MLRTLALVLIAANLLFLAWSQGWIGGAGGAGADREPQRLQRQVRPEALVLHPPQPAAAELPACVEAGPFPVVEIAPARAVLLPLLAAERVAEVPVDASGSVLLRVDGADEALAAQLLALRSDALGRGFRRCGG